MKKISVLMATVFVDMLGFGLVFPLLPFYALRLNADPWLIGWMIASFSVAQLAAAPLWGRFSDRYGRRPAILIGLGAAAVAFVIFGFADSVWMLFLSRIVQGLGGGTTGVAQAYVGDAVAPKDRAKALGWLSAATSAGVMIGPAIGSLTVNLGHAAPGLVAALLCVVNMVFAWKWLPETAPGKLAGKDSVARRPRNVGSAAWEIIRHPDRDVSQLIWIYAVGMLGFMSVTGVLALYMEASFGVTEHTIGLFFVYIGALSVLMRAVILGRLVDRYGEARVMRFGATSLALGLFTIPQAHNIFTMALIMGLVPVGTACLFPSVSALVTHRAPKDELGQVLGLQQSFGGLSRVFAPIWATAAFQGLGRGVPFYISGLVVAFVVLLAFRIPVAQPAVS